MLEFGAIHLMYAAIVIISNRGKGESEKINHKLLTLA